MEDQKPTNGKPTQENNKGGYGKRPFWQYLLLYILIGGVIYLIIYLLFFNGGYSNGSDSIY